MNFKRFCVKSENRRKRKELLPFAILLFLERKERCGIRKRIYTAYVDVVIGASSVRKYLARFRSVNFEQED